MHCIAECFMFLFSTEFEQAVLSMPIEDFSWLPVIMPGLCNWVVIRKKEGGIFF